MISRKISAKHLFTIALYAMLFPLIVLTFNNAPSLFLNIHVKISLMLVICLLTMQIFKNRLANTMQTFIITLVFMYPSLVLAAYPFSFLSGVFVLLLVTSGLLIPIFSIKTTWWLYTMGGKFPLPNDAKWLGKSKGNYESFIKTNVMVLFPITLILLKLSRMFGVSTFSQANTAALVLNIISTIVVFGLSLTLGMHIRKHIYNI